jgi:5-methylcytosine-specific restriction enzyme subunit McrC
MYPRTPPKRLELREWQRVEAELTAVELETLRSFNAGLTIQPISTGRYRVEASSIVGAIAAPQLELLIRPKVSIERLFYLLGYSRQIEFKPEPAHLAPRADLVEAFIAAFTAMVERALRRGLLAGYRTHEEAASTFHGRIRMSDQLRRRFGLPIPVELTYDDFTPDIEANRLIKAALRRAAQLRLRSPDLRRRVNKTLAALDMVSDVRYPAHAIPEITYTRLNERYRPAIELARLVIANTSLELEPGVARTTGLLLDMNKVFEDFLFHAIGDRLRTRVDPTARWRQGHAIYLDEQRRVKGKPDLSLWRRRECVFVGDAKYKSTELGEASDVYQLLAYCIATGLPRGMLMYAEAPATTTHRVVHGGPELIIESVDLAAPLADLLARIAEVSERVIDMASERQETARAA